MDPKWRELDWPDGERQINECDYLYLDAVREIEELTLELIVNEAKVQSRVFVPRDESELERLVAGGRPIETDVTCRAFQANL